MQATGTQDTPPSNTTDDRLKKPKRRWATKVRTGCNTCRLRRIKCGEEKPQCKRCIGSGRNCEYRDDASVSLSVIEPSSTLAPSTVRQNAAADEMFYFYRTFAIDILLQQYDCEIWLKTLLPFAHSQSYMWHATNALAAAYRNHLSPSKSSEAIALSEYQSAIQQLMELDYKHVDGTQKALVLATGTMLSCICVLRGEMNTSRLHSMNMINLFYQWRDRNTSLDLTSLFSLSPPFQDMIRFLLIRVDNQARNVYSVGFAETWEPRITPTVMPVDTFLHDKMAYSELEYLYNDLLPSRMSSYYHLSSEEDVFHYNTKAHFVEAFLSWDRKVEELLQTNRATELTIRPLRVRRVMVDIMMYSDISKGEMTWDSFTHEFRNILTLINQVYMDKMMSNAKLVHDPLRRSLGMFSWQSSITEPLMFTACRCRDRQVRLEALRLLWNLVGMDNVWSPSAEHIGAAAEFVQKEEIYRNADLDCSCAKGYTICENHRQTLMEPYDVSGPIDEVMETIQAEQIMAEALKSSSSSSEADTYGFANLTKECALIALRN